MTACHSTLFTLRSGQSGLGFYTTQRDAASPSAEPTPLVTIRALLASTGGGLDQSTTSRDQIRNSYVGSCCLNSSRSVIFRGNLPPGQPAQIGDGGGVNLH